MDPAPRSIEQQALLKAPGSRNQNDLTVLEHMLLKVAFMQSLPQDCLHGISQALLFREHRGGKQVVVQGQAGDEFFIILRGSVGISITDDESVTSQVALLEAGDHFGDLALMGPPGSARRATVTCREECSFAVLQRSAYDEFIKKQSRIVARDRLSLLNAASVFSKMPLDTRKAIAVVCTPRVFLPNSVIVHQDQLVEDLFIVASGHIKLVRELPKRDDLPGASEFLDNPSDNPFSQMKSTNKRYAHVTSPVRAYRSHEPDNLHLREHRARVLASGVHKLQRGVGRLVEAREGGLAAVAKRTMQEANTVVGIDTEVAKAFQHAHRAQRENRIFLEVATASPGDFFGEECLQKDSKASTSVIAQTSVNAFIINRWDLFKILSQEQLAAFAQAAIIGSIDENLLKEQFFRHLRWEHFRTALVHKIMQERALHKRQNPVNMWHRFRVPATPPAHTPWH